MKNKIKIKPLHHRKVVKLERILELAIEGELDEAFELYDSFMPGDKKHPEVRSVYLSLLHGTGDFDLALKEGHELQAYFPPGSNEHGLYIDALANSALYNLASREIDSYLAVRKKPFNDDEAEDYKDIKSLAVEEMSRLFANRPNSENLVLKHELVRFNMFIGDLDKGIKIAKDLLNEIPDFLPAISNLASLYGRNGDFDSALEQVEIGLKVQSDYAYLLHLKLDLQLLAGLPVDINLPKLNYGKQGLRDRLCLYLKTFRHAEILEEFKNKTPQEIIEVNDVLPGVDIVQKIGFVEYMQGDKDRGLSLWEYCSGWSSFQDKLGAYCLEELESGDNDIGCIAFSSLLRVDFNKYIKRFKEGDTKKYFELFKVALLLGDKTAVEFALKIVREMKSDAVRDVLLEFVEGSRGSKDVKMEAANILFELYGLKRIKLYIDGESREVELKRHKPREVEYPPALEKKLIRINKYLTSGDFQKAYNMISDEIKIHKDVPVLYNNLAKALEMMGRFEESEEIIEKVARDFPTYPTGQINLGIRRVLQGRIGEAKKLLKDTLDRTDLHESEIRSAMNLQKMIEKRVGEIS